MTSDELNRLVAEGIATAEQNEDGLRAEYEEQIAGAGLRAGSALRRSEALVAASSDEPWVPPPWAELLAAATLGLTWEKTRKRREKMASAAAAPLLSALGEANAVEVVLPQPTAAITDALGREIRYALTQAKEKGLSVRQTARLLETEVAELARWQASMFARTYTLLIANTATHQAVAQANGRFRRAGQTEFRTKRWVTAHDERVRQTHAMAEGQTRPFNEPFQVGGSLLQHPCDPAGNPNETWNCRCVVTYEEGAALVASDDPPPAALPSHETREDTMDTETGNAGSHVAEVKITGQFGFGVFTDETESPISFMPLDSFPSWSTTSWPEIGVTVPNLSAKGVTITVLDNDEEEVVGEPIPWEGVLAVEGVQSGDSTYAPRILLLESVGHRELPLPLMAQLVTANGHDGARLCGQIQNIWRADRPDLGEGAVAIMGSGVFSATAFGQEIAGYVDDKSLRGVSVDLVAAKYQVVTVEDLTPIPDDEVDLDVMMNGGYLLGLVSGEIGAATLCPLQALADATIALVASGEQRAVAFCNEGIRLVKDLSLVAAAAPIAPPRSCFEVPEPGELTPMTITDDGFVYGHAATWECHEAYRDRCVMAPRSRTGLAYFHTGEMLTAEGDLLPVGRWTVGGGHASINESRVGANAHYDNASTVGAYLRAYEGRHGIWTCGVLKSNVTPEQLRDMRGNPPSGDWRDGELILVHSVPVQGLPVFRHEARVMVASDGREVVTALITPPVECSCDDGSDFAIRIEALAQFANLDE